MVVVPPSPSNTLQPLPSGLNYFEVLGVPSRLVLDLDTLSQRYYELARKYHPDRYSMQPAPIPQYALQWTTALNRAFQTLKDPISRTEYVIELSGASTAEKSAKVPLDLAEAYFELQDLLGEPEGVTKLQDFRNDLVTQQTSLIS